jgi:hypothetical protein
MGQYLEAQNQGNNIHINICGPIMDIKKSKDAKRKAYFDTDGQNCRKVEQITNKVSNQAQIFKSKKMSKIFKPQKNQNKTLRCISCRIERIG